MIDEKKIIYAVLALAAVFFAMCLSIPTEWHVGQVKSGSLWSSMETGNAAGGHETGGHGDSSQDDHGGGH